MGVWGPPPGPLEQTQWVVSMLEPLGTRQHLTSISPQP